jgi:large subunit ribosomal protein L46
MYTPAPIETEADDSGDRRSLNRALRERLYFVMRRTSTANKYQFPQTLAVSDDVPLREYAEMALKSALPPSVALRTHFISNSPAAHLAHTYGLSYQAKTGYYGVKVFFYRAQLISGVDGTGLAAALGDGGTDFCWARDGELKEVLSTETYRAVQPLLFGTNCKVDLHLEYPEPIDEIAT